MMSIETLIGPVLLRPEQEGDQPFRFALFCCSRPPEWSRVTLAPDMRDALMRHQFAAQTASYLHQFPNARFDIIEREGAPIGRIVVDRHTASIHIVDLAIVPSRRGRGIGTAIMHALIAEAADRNVPIHLEVGDSNDPSLRLYLRLGFVPIEELPLYIRLAWTPPRDRAAALEGRTEALAP